MVEKLAYYFLSGNLKFVLTKADIDELSWNNQENFLHLTIYSHLFKNYPLGEEFCRLFFKRLLQYLEPHQEIHDGIFEFVCTLMKKKCGPNQFCYRHYIFNGDLKNIITIKETNNMVINGTTGMKTWEAAIILSDWIMSNKEMFHDKHVLELGAGVGFTGITIGKLCTSKSITITDCHNDVLKLLVENVALNLPELSKEETLNHICFRNEERQINVKKLDWNFIENLNDDVNPDIIIGADIVYDPSILTALCNIIHTFIKRNPKIEVFISSIIRNEETFRKFLVCLDEIDVAVEEHVPPKCIYLEWDQNIPHSLLKIKKKI